MALKASEIVKHLQRYLPVYTDKFAAPVSATATTAGNTITVKWTSHGLSAGDSVVVFGGQTKTPLESVVDNGDGTVRFTTESDHDLTEPKLALDPTTLTLEMTYAPWDGVHEIVAIPNRRTFEIEIASGNPLLSTDGFLIEDRSKEFGGNQKVATVIDPDTFTITVGASLPTSSMEIGILAVQRVYAAADFRRAVDFYDRHLKDEYALFLIMTETDIAKDRNTPNESTAMFSAQDDQRLLAMHNFSTAVFIPTADDPLGNRAVDAARGEINDALTRVLYGFTFDDECTGNSFATVSNGNGQGEYNTAYYVHVYDWQRPEYLTYEQGFARLPDVAFRDVDFTFNEDEGPIVAAIDLDDEPL